MKKDFFGSRFWSSFNTAIAFLSISGAAASALAIQAPPRNDVPHTIAYHGDSTIFGRRVPKPCWKVFDENIPANFTTRDESAPGATTKNLLDGTDRVHPDWKTWVSQSTDKIIITNHAINDTDQFGVEVFKANYRRIIDIAHEAGKFIILETPNPTMQGARLRVFSDAMRMVAAEKNVPVIDQYSYLTWYMKANNLKIEDVVPDGYHPTPFIHEIKGKYVAKKFREIMGLSADAPVQIHGR